MKAMRFQAFRSVVGQKWIETKIHRFPAQGWGSKAIDNIIYVWAKPCTLLTDIARIEASSGKQVRLSIVPNAIIKHTDI